LDLKLLAFKAKKFMKVIEQIVAQRKDELTPKALDGEYEKEGGGEE